LPRPPPPPAARRRGHRRGVRLRRRVPRLRRSRPRRRRRPRCDPAPARPRPHRGARRCPRPGPAMSLAAADRAATVEALRRRLQRLGGLPGGPLPAPPSPQRRPPPPAPAPAPEGFTVHCDGVLARHVRIELGAFLEVAGVSRPARPEELLGLAWGRPAEAGEGPWPDAEVAVLDIET